jgi:hypothetical protein
MNSAHRAIVLAGFARLANARVEIGDAALNTLADIHGHQGRRCEAEQLLKCDRAPRQGGDLNTSDTAPELNNPAAL